VAFTAVESIDGDVSYSLQLNPQSFETHPVQAAPPFTMAVMLIIPLTTTSDLTMEGSYVAVSWRTQQYAYTWADLFTSMFANIGMSLTLLGLIFPWWQPNRRRKFMCDMENINSDAGATDSPAEQRHVALLSKEPY
jgi:hypothetical protein